MRSLRRCVVPSCTEEMRRNELPLLSYHGFPASKIHEKVRQQWIDTIRPILPPTFSLDLIRYAICSRHFKPTDFCLREIGRSQLIPSSIPSQHLGDESLVDNDPGIFRTMSSHRRCVIANCRRGHLNRSSPIPLFGLKPKWIPFVRTSNGNMSWQPPKCADICALHFEDNMFLDTSRQRLEEWAYPTISSPWIQSTMVEFGKIEPKIVKACCVPSCSSRIRGADTSYHGFPGHKLHQKLRNEWIRIIRGLLSNQEWEPIVHKICSRHFAESDFRTDTGSSMRRLRVTAVPAINLYPITDPFQNDEQTMEVVDSDVALPTITSEGQLNGLMEKIKVRTCVVPSCTTVDRRREESLSWHTFSKLPMHNHMRIKWIALIQNLRNDQTWQPIDDSRICSRHFLKEQLYMSGTRRKLIGQPLPTLFLHETNSNSTKVQLEVQDVPNIPLSVEEEEELEDPLRLDNEDNNADDFIRCTIPNCPNNLNRPSPSETLFSFRDKDTNRMRPGWVLTLRAVLKTDNWNPAESDRICSIHFAEEQIYFNFVNEKWVKHVKGTPTLNLRLAVPPPVPMQGQKTNTNNKLRCIIPGCDHVRLNPAQRSKSYSIWYHKFKDSWSWIMRKLLNNPTWTAPPNCEICYLHFVSADLHQSDGKLRPSAIPRLNLGCNFDTLAQTYKNDSPGVSGTPGGLPLPLVAPIPKPQQNRIPQDQTKQPTLSALRISSLFTSMCKLQFPSHFQNPEKLPATRREKEVVSKLLETFLRLQEDENASVNPGDWQQINFDSFIDESEPDHLEESTNSTNSLQPTIKEDPDPDVFKVIHFDPPPADDIPPSPSTSSRPPGILTVRPSSPMSPISNEEQEESTDPTSYRPPEKRQSYLPPDDLPATDFTTQVIQGIRHASAKSSHLQKNPASHYRKKPGRKTPLTPRLLL